MLLLRVWREDHQLVARILETQDVMTGKQTSRAAAGIDQICEIVRSWLESVASGDDSVTTR
jgi:hypothetical protein